MGFILLNTSETVNNYHRNQNSHCQFRHGSDRIHRERLGVHDGLAWLIFYNTTITDYVPFAQSVLVMRSDPVQSNKIGCRRRQIPACSFFEILLYVYANLLRNQLTDLLAKIPKNNYSAFIIAILVQTKTFPAQRIWVTLD